MGRSGSYDRRIQFQRATLLDDGFSKVDSWANHGTPVFAAFQDVSDSEKWRAGEVQAQITSRFRVRYSAFTAGITPKDRIVFEGREYNITGIKEVAGRKRELEISAVARIDQS